MYFALILTNTVFFYSIVLSCLNVKVKNVLK